MMNDKPMPEAEEDRLIIEMDLTAEEIAIIDAGHEEWRTNPQSFVDLETL